MKEASGSEGADQTLPQLIQSNIIKVKLVGWGMEINERIELIGMNQSINSGCPIKFILFISFLFRMGKEIEEELNLKGFAAEERTSRNSKTKGFWWRQRGGATNSLSFFQFKAKKFAFDWGKKGVVAELWRNWLSCFLFSLWVGGYGRCSANAPQWKENEKRRKQRKQWMNQTIHNEWRREQTNEMNESIEWIELVAAEPEWSGKEKEI